VTLIKARNLPLETIKADIRASPDSFARFDSDYLFHKPHNMHSLLHNLYSLFSLVLNDKQLLFILLLLS
jgi:hypothetical protein